MLMVSDVSAPPPNTMTFSGRSRASSQKSAIPTSISVVSISTAFTHGRSLMSSRMAAAVSDFVSRLSGNWCTSIIVRGSSNTFTMAETFGCSLATNAPSQMVPLVEHPAKRALGSSLRKIEVALSVTLLFAVSLNTWTRVRASGDCAMRVESPEANCLSSSSLP